MFTYLLLNDIFYRYKQCSLLILEYTRRFITQNVCVYVCVCVCVCVCVPMPTHCTITGFQFRAGWIDGIECGLFSNHAPLEQPILRVGQVSV